MLLWTHVCFHFTYDYISFVQVTKKIRYNLRFFYGSCCSTKAIARSKPNEAHTRTISFFLHTWHSQRSQTFKNNLISINCYIIFIVFAISSWWCPLSDWNDILSHQTIYCMLVQIYLTTWHSFICNMEMLFMEEILCTCDNWWLTRHCDQGRH